MTTRALETLADAVVAAYRRGHRDLPWRREPTPYHVWICEIMAQQTRLEVVVPYWTRWMARFPTVAALAAAPLDDVLAAWAGLGYYSRARNLHRAAQVVVADHGGELPRTVDGLRSLPGIGRYTAGAIASIAMDVRAPLVDGNVIRVFARVFGLEGDLTTTKAQATLWDLAERAVPVDAPGDFNQGLMELGATVCTPRSPACLACPLAAPCVARKTGRQEELPQKRVKLAPRALGVDLGLVRRRGAWLMVRRPAKGLYGGLWELPTLESLGAEPAASTPDAERVQKLSHRTLRYRVFTLPKARVSTRPPPAPYDAARYFPPDALGALGMSSATRALLVTLGAPAAR